MPYFETNQGKIYFEILGAGEPLVFLHGISLDSRMWREQIDYFKNYFQVIHYDLRYYGKSESHIPYFHVEDLKNLLDYLNINTAHLVGLSRGGRISIDFTLEYPKRVQSIALASSSLSGYIYPKSVIDRQNIMASLASKDISAAKEFWFTEPIFTKTFQNPVVAEKVKNIIVDYSGIHWKEGFSTLEKWKILKAEDKLPEIKVPTLIIIGNEDTSYFKDVSKIIHESVPQSKQIIFEASGHMVNMEYPEKFNYYLHNFLKEVKIEYK